MLVKNGRVGLDNGSESLNKPILSLGILVGAAYIFIYMYSI